MFFETKCPRCGSLFETDTAYLGTTRQCQVCRGSFVLECPREVAEALRAATEKRPEPFLLRDPRGPQRRLLDLACPTCTAGFRLQVVEGTPEVTCVYCGTVQRVVVAQRMVNTLRTAEERMWRALLAGVPPESVIGEVVADGVTARGAAVLVKARVPVLPMIRLSALHRSRAGTFRSKLGPPPGCEVCGGVLSERPALHVISWRRVRPRRPALSFSPGAVILAAALEWCVDRRADALQGAYYLCGACGVDDAPFTEASWAGYPVTEGFAFWWSRALPLSERVMAPPAANVRAETTT